MVALIRPSDLLLALPLGAVWLASPFIAFWISQPLADQRRRPLPAEDQQLLRRTARKTWRFFEMFVTAEDNWLPPDNYQEDPKGVLARRTSPTNIGLYLLSVLAARDLGYITLTDFAERIDRTLGTLERLERYRGHLYNWYDTATGQPLQPAYVSTVDSGNFVGSLLTLAAGCREASEAPLVGMPLLDALEDTLGLLREGIAAAKQTDIHRALDDAGGGACGGARGAPVLPASLAVRWHFASSRCWRRRRQACCACPSPPFRHAPGDGRRAWMRPRIGRAACLSCCRPRLASSTSWLPDSSTRRLAATATCPPLPR